MITGPSYSAADYLAAFQALMPRGAAWPRDPDAMQTRVAAGLAPSAVRLDAAGNQLLIEVVPSTADALLPEWEESVGLPFETVGPAPTLAKRRRAVLALLVGERGFSRSSLTAFAAFLGFDLTLTLFAPFRASQNSVGQPLTDLKWANTVMIKITPSASPPFADAVGVWDRAFCLAGLAKMAPAHLTVLFQS